MDPQKYFEAKAIHFRNKAYSHEREANRVREMMIRFKPGTTQARTLRTEMERLNAKQAKAQRKAWHYGNATFEFLEES